MFNAARKAVTMADLPLTTERLILRRFESEDLLAFVNYRNKPEIARYQSWSSFSEADGSAFFEEQRWLEFDTNDTWFQIAAIRRSDCVLVGDVAVRFFDDGRQTELGFTIDSTFQKQGYGFEAVSAIVHLMFSVLMKRRIVAIVDTRNVDAHRLLKSIGFRREPDYRRPAFFKGDWCDEDEYALLRDEFDHV